MTKLKEQGKRAKQWAIYTTLIVLSAAPVVVRYVEKLFIMSTDVFTAKKITW